MNWLRNRWYARMRKVDIEILWPSCVRQASSLDRARAVFATHALADPAWMILGHETVLATIDGFGGGETMSVKRSKVQLFTNPERMDQVVLAFDYDALLNSHRTLLGIAQRYREALLERCPFNEAIQKAEEFHQ